MSHERLDRIRKLQRLRELQETREATALRTSQRECSDAESAEADALRRLHALAVGKAASAAHGLDVERYRATLALEAHGIDAAVAAADARRDADERHARVRERHAQAAAATKVADSRRQRLAGEVRHEEEVRDADRLADLRMATKGNQR